MYNTRCYSVVRDRPWAVGGAGIQVCIIRPPGIGALAPAQAASSFSDLAYQVLRRDDAGDQPRPRVAHACEAGDLTAGEIPVPIPNTEVKPRWADCTARESVWESRSSPT